MKTVINPQTQEKKMNSMKKIIMLMMEKELMEITMWMPDLVIIPVVIVIKNKIDN